MTDASDAKAESEGRVSPWIKALVVFHLIAITAWSLPRPRAELASGAAQPFGSDYILVGGDRVRKLAPISAYVQVTGSWQYWDMFAPDPANQDQWADAEIEYLDGTKRIVGYPRMYRLNLLDKYTKERYRKYYERASSVDFAYTWPRFAIELAKIAPRTAENPPRTVTLHKHVLVIQPPGRPQPTEYSDEAYFRYVLRPEDLREMGAR